MRLSAGFLLEILSGLLFVAAAAAASLRLMIDGAFGLSLLAAGAALAVYGLKRPKGVLPGTALSIVGMVVLGAVASGGLSMVAPGTTLVFSASTYQVPQHNLVLTATTGAGSISITYSDNLQLAYQVTLKYAGGRHAFPTFAIVPKVTNSSNGDTFRLNINGAGAVIMIVLGKGYALNASLQTTAGNILFEQSAGTQVLSLDCSTSAGDVELVGVTAPHIDCNSDAGNVEASIAAVGVTGVASLSSSAGNVELNVIADSTTGIWLKGGTSLGTVTPPAASGMEILSQSDTDFEAQTANYSSFSHQYQVTCISDFGNVELSFGIPG